MLRGSIRGMQHRFLHSIRHPFSALIALIFLVLALSFFAACIAHAPFHFWYWDVAPTLAGLLGFVAIAGACWDGMLIALGNIRTLVHRLEKRPACAPEPLCLWRRYGFISLGVWPFALIIVTGLGIVLSANVTELNLALLDQGITHWRDGFFWGIEQDAIARLTEHKLFLGGTDWLYLLCWPLQILSIMAVMIRTRNLLLVTQFCASYVLLYFMGRWIGCFTPVLGPVFFKPELYGYIKDTFSQIQVDYMWGVFRKDNTILAQGSILKGGLSAMPSLHVAMVTLCGYWLVRTCPAMLWPACFWIIAVWYTTVLLGWHYISDGIGGMLLAPLVVWLNARYFDFWRLRQ